MWKEISEPLHSRPILARRSGRQLSPDVGPAACGRPAQAWAPISLMDGPCTANTVRASCRPPASAHCNHICLHTEGTQITHPEAQRTLVKVVGKYFFCISLFFLYYYCPKQAFHSPGHKQKGMAGGTADEDLGGRYTPQSSRGGGKCCFAAWRS